MIISTINCQRSLLIKVKDYNYYRDLKQICRRFLFSIFEMLSIDFDENEGLYRVLDNPIVLQENRNRESSYVKIKIIPLYKYHIKCIKY